MTGAHQHSSAHDFDFFFGSWQIVNERLKSRLTNADEWERFEAPGDCRPILGVIGNIADFRSTPNGTTFAGASLCLFNPATGQSSIYWADNVSGVLQPALVGRFIGGVGVFFGGDQHEGRPVVVRFRWSDITATSARWGQAFSVDRGETWETNWIMTFTRRQAD